MRRLVALVVAFFALTGIAVAHDNGATVYCAKLAPVGVATTPTGEAVLIDGKNHNIAMIDAKGLTTGTSYPWHVHSFAPGVTDPCTAGAAQGPIVSSFTFGVLTGNENGDGFAQAPSPSFDWGPATNQYYVNIHNPVTLAPIACGVLTRVASKPHRWDTQRGFAVH